MLTLDFETYYSKEYSLSKMSTEAYIRDERFEVIGVGVQVNADPPQWFSGTHDEIAAWLRQFEIEREYVVMHHAAFDGAILAWRFQIKPKYYLDTLSMARPLTGHTVGGSLAALAKKFMLGEKGTEVVQAMGKRRADFTPEELAQYGEYCKNDVYLTYMLYKVLLQYSTPKEMYIIDLMIRMFTDPVLTLDAALLGNHLSEVMAKKKLLLDRLQIHDNKRAVAILAGEEEPSSAALMSNQKLAKLLESLGVEVPMKVSPTAAKRGENTMTYAFGKNDYAFKVLLEHPDVRVQAIVAARLGVKSTLEETRTEAFMGIGLRGTLPIMLNYWGAHTGRASGADNINLQNLPRGGALRKAICAPEGHTLIAADSSQIEARVVAWLAGQDDLVEDFRNGVDIYSKFATDVFERPVDKSTKVERFVGKTCILGLGYGMGPPKFQNTIKIGQGGVSMDMPLEDCKRTVELYRKKYPMIPKLWKQGDAALDHMVRGMEYQFGVTIKLLCDAEGVHLPNDMVIRYPNLRKTKDGYEYDSRKGPVKLYGGKFVENLVQALARIVVFDQMASTEQKLRLLDSKDGRYRTVLTVHDEVVVCVPDHMVGVFKNTLETAMSTSPSWAPGLPVACEVGAGKTYGTCK